MNDKTWNKIHKDFKGVVNGVRYVLVFDEKHGTISVPMDSFVAKKYSVGVLSVSYTHLTLPTILLV